MSLVRGASILFIFSKNKLSSSVQSLSNVQLFSTPWTEAHQASQSITNSRSLLKLMFIEFTRSNYLILCRPLLLLPSVFTSIRVFSNESALHIGLPKYWSFIFSISPSNEYSGLISFNEPVFRFIYFFFCFFDLFISALIFIISLFLLIFHFICSSFLVASVVSLGCLLVMALVSWDKSALLYFAS